MHLVAQPDVFYRPQPRVSAFPAPLCEACNDPMKLNGEYRASDDATLSRREYQCMMCASVTMVRRTRR